MGMEGENSKLWERNEAAETSRKPVAARGRAGTYDCSPPVPDRRKLRRTGRRTNLMTRR